MDSFSGKKRKDTSKEGLKANKDRKQAEKAAALAALAVGANQPIGGAVAEERSVVLGASASGTTQSEGETVAGVSPVASDASASGATQHNGGAGLVSHDGDAGEMDGLDGLDFDNDATFEELTIAAEARNTCASIAMRKTLINIIIRVKEDQSVVSKAVSCVNNPGTQLPEAEAALASARGVLWAHLLSLQLLSAMDQVKEVENAADEVNTIAADMKEMMYRIEQSVEGIYTRVTEQMALEAEESEYAPVPFEKWNTLTKQAKLCQFTRAFMEWTTPQRLSESRADYEKRLIAMCEMHTFVAVRRGDPAFMKINDMCPNICEMVGEMPFINFNLRCTRHGVNGKGTVKVKHVKEQSLKLPCYIVECKDCKQIRSQNSKTYISEDVLLGAKAELTSLVGIMSRVSLGGLRLPVLFTMWIWKLVPHRDHYTEELEEIEVRTVLDQERVTYLFRMCQGWLSQLCRAQGLTKEGNLTLPLSYGRALQLYKVLSEARAMYAAIEKMRLLRDSSNAVMAATPEEALDLASEMMQTLTEKPLMLTNTQTGVLSTRAPGVLTTRAPGAVSSSSPEQAATAVLLAKLLQPLVSDLGVGPNRLVPVLASEAKREESLANTELRAKAGQASYIESLKVEAARKQAVEDAIHDQRAKALERIRLHMEGKT